MERKLPLTSHFFKVMIPGFDQNLKLPPVFCRKVKEDKSKWAVLKSRKGAWNIKIHRNDEALITFKDGWPEFVHHHSLSVGDFLVFEHTGQFHFDVIVFGPSACEKEFLVGSKTEKEKPAEAMKTKSHIFFAGETGKKSGVSYNTKNPCFVLTMLPHHGNKTSQVTIPAAFVKANNLGQQSGVALRDPRKRAWAVTLSVQRSPQFRVRMKRGWSDFYVSNGLKEGDVCVFELNPRSSTSANISFDVQIFPATSKMLMLGS